jgi:hypothetical protein
VIETALRNRGYWPRHMALAVFVVMLSSVDVAGQPVSIATVHGSPGEDATRAQLTRLLDAYDMGKWLFTRSVVIDERAIPHSHPVLTLHTRHSDDLQLLSTFVHEQLHWHLVAKDDQVQSAIGDIVKMYPSVPSGGAEGARDADSTYLHLIVNYLELQAMRQLVGDQQARDIFEFWTTDHYTWIYETVLSDEATLGDVVAEHGLDVD